MVCTALIRILLLFYHILSENKSEKSTEFYILKSFVFYCRIYLYLSICGGKYMETHGIKLKDKIGYALGDTAGILTFGLVTPFQLMFYTDVLHIDGNKAAVLLLIAKIWDAINDPMWGAFIDSRKPSKRGRFRPYILGASIPLAISAFLMFFKIPGLTSGQYLAYAYVTYILYGMMYTGANIPFGSLASVITDDEIERSSLSMWRSIGAGLGGLPAQILLPLFVYSYNEKTGEKDLLDPSKLAVAVAVISVISVIVFFIHYKMTTERVTVAPKQSNTKYNVFSSLKELLTNKEFVIIALVSMLLIGFQQFTQNNYNYLFKDFYGKPGLFALVTVCTYLPMALFLPFMGKLVRKFGKKEICVAGAAFSAVINFIMYLMKFTPLVNNPYIFLVLVFFSGAGTTFLVLEIWALTMDVIDYHELRSGRQEEGTCYSVISFTRKLGQAAAVSGAATLISRIGYSTEHIGNQSADVLAKLYDVSTLVPAIALTALFIILAFGYKFNKKNLEIMNKQLAEARGK